MEIQASTGSAKWQTDAVLGLPQNELLNYSLANQVNYGVFGK